MKKLKIELEEKAKEASRLQEEYRKVNEWILTNVKQLKSLESRDKTINILRSALSIAQTLLLRIHENTNIEKIVEELADKIEENVKEVYKGIFPEDKSFNFKHVGKGMFLSTINNEPITHPSGSQRVAISLGIMLSLAETFGLPMILDEAFDRMDVRRLKFFCEHITGLANTGYQICLAAYTSFNIEKNIDIIPHINNWKGYLVERGETTLEKNIKPLKPFQISQ